MDTTRRILSAAAATGVLSLASAVPSVAKPDWTEPAAPSDGSTPLCSPPPACHTTDEPRTVTREVHVDDDAWEYVQMGLGALVGATLAGAAGAAGVAMRHRGQHAPHPS